MSAEIRKTTCNRDCPDACRIVAHVEEGRITRIGGDPDHPVTQGFLCYRTNHFLDTQYSKDRITTPLLRRGDSFVPIGWEEAMDLAAANLLQIKEESGASAIFHYKSGGTLGILTALADHFFERFGPVTKKRGDICSGAGDFAQETDFGDEDSHDLFDLLHAKNILVWGKNVFVSSPHTIPVLKSARERGARLTLIDPVWHKTATICDEFMQPRPGGDFALAMAVAQILFRKGLVSDKAASMCDHLPAFRALAERKTIEAWCREADVSEAQAEKIARALAEGPTAILVGWGMGRRYNGASIVRALDALSAISGNLGVKGGGSSFYFKRRGAYDTSFLSPRPPPRTVCEPLFGRELLTMNDPPIRAVWVTAGNPVVMLPESHAIAEALRSREFVVVVDSFLTDTARCATLVLPTTTLLEADDLLGAYGHHYLGVARPVVPPPEGVKSDLEILQMLAARTGLSEEMAGSAREWQERIIAPRLGPRGITLEKIENGYVRSPMSPEVLFEDKVFPTATGKAQLMTEMAPEAPAAPSERPLWLMALSTDKAQSSQWAKPQEGPLVVTVHPESAGGIADGGLARMESEIGSLTVRIRHDARQRRDVALTAKGGHLGAGRAANALVRARVTDFGEGGAIYDERVRLLPLS